MSIKQKLLAVGAAILAALGAVLAFVTLGKTRKKVSPLAPIPRPPPLPDVEADDAPDVDTEFNDSPADDFEKIKADTPLVTSDDKLFESINDKFDK